MNARPSPPPPPPNPLELSFSADAVQLATVRRALRDWLSRTRITADQCADVLLAVGEACTNAIEHGHRLDGGTIRLRSWIVGDFLQVTVSDSGCWKPNDNHADPLRGRGIPLMRALMESMRMSTNRSGTVVELGTAIRS
ncbi:ATP-binding protein [Nocardia sp. CA-128927]|uniref:ATP-binding protein n=1 Tax=Nocardia sp. CA-128927 TaxID=3239975 RepID=UPI003D99A5F7